MPIAQSTHEARQAQRLKEAQLTLRYLDRYDTPLTRLKLLIEKLPNFAIVGLPAGLITMGVGTIAALSGDASWLVPVAGLPMLFAGFWGVGIETSGSGVNRRFRHYSIAALNRGHYERVVAEAASAQSPKSL